DKAKVVQRRVDADRCEAREIKILTFRRCRLQDHLKLIEMLQPVGVFAVAAIGRSARGLYIGGAPRFGSERAQRRRWMESAGPDRDVERLQRHPPPLRQKALEGEKQRWEAQAPPSTLFGIGGVAGNGACRGGGRPPQYRRRKPRTQ